MVSYRWYIQAYTSHMTSGTDESYESYMTVYACHMTCCLRAGGARRSGPQQNRAWNAAAHRVWIARVFIVPVHHSTRRCHWAAVTASLGQLAPQWTQVVTRATDVGGSGGVAPPPPAAGASHRCRRRRRWPQSRTADVGSSGSVVTLPGSTSSRL